jgi:hypothetical protein
MEEVASWIGPPYHHLHRLTSFFLIHCNRMDTCFQAKQSVELLIPEAPLPITGYLRCADRVVGALSSAGEVFELGDDLFQLQLKPISFLSLSIQPIVAMRVWNEGADCLHIQSVKSEILGLEQFNNPNFQLNLTGELRPVEQRRRTYLQGHVQLSVEVEMPMPLALTPKPILESSGNAIMSGVLSGMKQRLKKNLIQDYQDWASQSGVLLSSC